MTSSVAAAAAASPQSKTTTTTATKPPQPAEAPPVSILPTPAAQTYAHVHPAVLLAWFALRFRSLVADPVATLASDVPVTAGLQVAYLVTCLPQAGSSSSHDDTETKKTITTATTTTTSSTTLSSASSSPSLSSASTTRALGKHHRRKQSPQSIVNKLTVKPDFFPSSLESIKKMDRLT